jgi:hypothetical protein
MTERDAMATEHDHEYDELEGDALTPYTTELRAYLDQLFPTFPAEEIDEVITSDSFQYARCSCGDWMVKMRGN